MKMNFSSTLALFVLLGLTPLQAETPAEGLARYEAAVLPTAPGKEPPEFAVIRSLALEIVQKHGVALIPLILDRSVQWKGEEGLFYMPLIIEMPVEPAIEALRKGTRDPDPKKALWSREFLTELEDYLGDMRKNVSKILEETKAPEPSPP